MSAQRFFLLSLPLLKLAEIFLHGNGGLNFPDQVYVILRLPRGNHWLALNRGYRAIGYMTNQTAQALLTEYSEAICSTWEGDYPHGGFRWKDSTWFEAKLDWCPNPACEGVADNLHGQPRCGSCGRFVKLR